MRGARLDEMARKVQERLATYGPGNVRLLVQVVRQLAQGRPLTTEQVDQHIAALRLSPAEAHRFLRELTERDVDDWIIGAIGLSLGEHPHRLTVEGVPLHLVRGGHPIPPHLAAAHGDHRLAVSGNQPPDSAARQP